MRKLLITRGPQGAGKSTTLRQIGLEAHTISPDQIRRMLTGPVMLSSGALSTSQENEARVWSMVQELLHHRMARGELLAVDATHRAPRDFRLYIDLAKQYRYDIACLDFSEIPLQRALAQNQARPPHEVVPEAVLRRTHVACVNGTVPQGIVHIGWQDDGQHVDAAQHWLREPIHQADAYDHVCIIGDIQGCWAPLKTWFDAHPFRDDVLYVFVGDLCDRGLENGAVLRHLLPLAAKPNVRIHWGNHETFLHQWARGETVNKAEFQDRTLPQLIAAGITPADMDAFCDHLVDVTLYTRNGLSVLVSHGGLATVPAQPHTLAARQYMLGTGHYNDPVDQRFADQAPDGWIQVHGHRNPTLLPAEAAPRSYNLEGHVEFGGHLRVLVHKDDIAVVDVPNPHFKSLATRMQESSLRADELAIFPHWLQPTPSPPTISVDTLTAMRAHGLINEKVSKTRPWISAFNFTRDAFFQREWDALNVRARGLFVNNETREIAARSYDKFFNMGERPETKQDSLQAHLKWPLTAYRKDNGYLGILGYDARTDALLFCSKSTPDSDFARWFEDIFDATVSPGHKTLLCRFLRDTQSAMAFEVIDPENDPHIIDYEKPSLVLLDVIRRAETFERVDFARLQRIGKHFGLQTKERVITLKRWAIFQGWLLHVQAENYTLNGSHIEGFVLEDQAGFQFKIKLDYYAFWKSMRSLKDRILAVRKSNKPLKRDLSEPRAAHFYEWAVNLPDDVLRQDIASLRRLYLSKADIPIQTPTQPMADTSKALAGFVRALDNLAMQSTIKQSTADALVTAALNSPEKRAVLQNHPIQDRLLRAATPGEQQRTRAAATNVDGMVSDAPPSETPND